jgi:hypothetical protein
LLRLRRLEVRDFPNHRFLTRLDFLVFFLRSSGFPEVSARQPLFM